MNFDTSEINFIIETEGFYCLLCEKEFTNEQNFNSHAQGKKH